MSSNWLERAELLVGAEGSKKLKSSNVLIVGLGGVGSFAAEFIARAGIGKMTIVDGDDVDITNINRQLPALHSTVGKQKVEEVGKRLLDINPTLALTQIDEFLNPERMDEILKAGNFDYVMDCIDSISPKVSLIKACRYNKVKCVSSMGAGGKMNPHQVTVKDIAKVKGCKLGKRIKERLKKDNINRGIRAVYSPETPLASSLQLTDGTNFKKSFYGTSSFMPAIFGLYAAAEVINHLRK
ncbi:MAG: tRNA threonylcarbamoyladenosine dehydratase [Flavobacteriales bacterium]|jgi:tRNA A37 threonylcarbamoyladenosine dehydratase|nr:tRNA threonylcarbamoyladenosine dehydratase [Flavobacteriales bacterium]